MGPNGKRTPAAPPSVKKVGAANDQEWRVKRVIPEETPDKNGEVKSERERAMERQIREMRQQMSKLQGQVERMQRVDGPGARTRDHQLLQTVLESNLALQEEIHQALRPDDDFEGMPFAATFYDLQLAERTRQREHTAEIARNVAVINRMLHAQQERTESCPCGKHHGIRFVERGVILEDNLCPKEWWFKQSHHAFYHGELGAFMQEHPFKKYLKQYEK